MPKTYREKADYRPIKRSGNDRKWSNPDKMDPDEVPIRRLIDKMGNPGGGFPEDRYWYRHIEAPNLSVML